MAAANPLSTKFSLVALVAAAALAAGCASMVTPMDAGTAFRPIELAATQSASSLQMRAEQGDAQAQLALSIALSHGLNGVQSPDEGRIWRARSSQPRGYMPITQYTAAFNGQPSRINIINVPRYDVSSGQLAMIDSCIVYLESRSRDSAVCGGPELALRLSTIWANAK